MQKNSINAKFVSVSPIQVIGEKKTKFSTIIVDITENPQYPNTPTFQLIGNRTEFGKQLKAGDEIKLEYVIEARSYEKDGERKQIVNLNVINIFKTALTSLSLPTTSSDDDLPF